VLGDANVHCTTLPTTPRTTTLLKLYPSCHLHSRRTANDFLMAPAVAYPTQQPHYLTPYPQDPSESSHEGDFKASYEDLIDDQDAPYSKTTGHRTISIDPVNAAAGHRRGTSFPLSQQPSFSSEFHGTQESVPRKGVEWGYPPSPPKRDRDKPSLWAQVCLYRVVRVRGLNNTVAGARLPGVQTICAHRSGRNDH
jgi:hypothetical protein